MLISYILITIIFAYAIYTMLRFVKKSKEGGACAHCSLKNSCQTKKCSTSIYPIVKNNQSIDKK